MIKIYTVDLFNGINFRVYYSKDYNLDSAVNWSRV